MKHIKLLNAINFAAIKHREQRRKDQKASPYINHPIAVANLLANVGKVTDLDVLISAILHDIIEDTKTNPEEIEELFGNRIKNIVLEVTDRKELPKEERKRLQIENAKNISGEATLIKIADKTLNIIDITDSPPKDWDLERRLKYLEWAEAVINNCSKENKNLDNNFYATLNECRKRMQYD
jgi:(p)ppGpp synthase/HD superfamily hydrolase